MESARDPVATLQLCPGGQAGQMDKAGDHSSQNNMYKDTVSWEWRADFWDSRVQKDTSAESGKQERAALREQHEAGAGTGFCATPGYGFQISTKAA